MGATSQNPDGEQPTPAVNKIPLALGAAAAAVGALWLALLAFFPYFYAESGSGRYAREHRFEGFAALVGAAALLWFAWYCVRRSFSAGTWLAIVGVLAYFGILRGFANYRRVPGGAYPVGGAWYVVATHEPAEIDTVRYRLFYKKSGHYQPVDDLISEYHFVPPDCITFRGLRVSHRPRYAMCGYRSPAGTYDTTVADETLIGRARGQQAFRHDWESIVQQQGFRPASVRP